MSDSRHDLFLKYKDTMLDLHSDMPFILVVGREPNNPHPFRPTIGDYPLKAITNSNGRKSTVAFWDQSYGTVGKTAGMSCSALKDVARRVQASPIIFTDVMPTPAAYSPGSDVPRKAREDASEKKINTHHDEVFSLREVMDRVSVVILAGHRHGSFSKDERSMLKFATNSFAKRCSEKIAVVETKSMFGNNQPWNLEAIGNDKVVTERINESVQYLLELDKDNFGKTG